MCKCHTQVPVLLVAHIVGIMHAVLADNGIHGSTGQVNVIKRCAVGTGRPADIVSFNQGAICIVQINAINIRVFYLVASDLVVHRIQTAGITVYLNAVITTINDVVLDLGIAGVVSGCCR